MLSRDDEIVRRVTIEVEKVAAGWTGHMLSGFTHRKKGITALSLQTLDFFLARPARFERATYGFEDRPSEFPNLLIL